MIPDMDAGRTDPKRRRGTGRSRRPIAGGPQLGWADVTPEVAWLNRRAIMAGMAGALGLGLSGTLSAAAAQGVLGRYPASAWSTDATPNTYDEITNYNNFYEFGFDKGDPARNAGRLTLDPWSVEVDGLVDRPGSYGIEDILGWAALEERIYRLRCVEAWSMVIPWIGFELAQLLDRVGVQSGARYVAFETLMRPLEMPGQRRGLLDWPYREGLRLDEAAHPLTILATGLYGDPLPPQNGAPIRLVVPWKYGFKSIKSIVRISLVADEPPATWKMMQGSEYGFYANVNPEVDHPRWSQATERVIGAGIFAPRRETEIFNGYGEAVAGLYAGMDLRTHY